MRYPLAFAYRLLSPRLLTVITTVNHMSGVNAAPVDFVSPASFNPAIVMISFNPTIRTYKNIKETNDFVINLLPRQYIDQILKCAERYPEGVDKLELVGLRHYPSEIVAPPRIREANVWLECRLIEEKRIGDHYATFSEVLMAEVKDEIIKEGDVDLTKTNHVLHIVKDNFAVDYKIIKHQRYDYV